MAKDEKRYDPEKLELLHRIEQLELLVRDSTAQAGGIKLDPAFDQWKRWAGLSAQEKTELAAKTMFGEAKDGERMFQIFIEEHPKVTIPAHSEDEAIGRYNRLCGIRQSDKPHNIALAA